MPRHHTIDRNDAQAAVERYRQATGDEEAILIRVAGPPVRYGVTGPKAPNDWSPGAPRDPSPLGWQYSVGARAFVQRMTDYLDGFDAGFDQGRERGHEEAASDYDGDPNL